MVALMKESFLSSRTRRAWMSAIFISNFLVHVTHNPLLIATYKMSPILVVVDHISFSLLYSSFLVRRVTELPLDRVSHYHTGPTKHDGTVSHTTLPNGPRLGPWTMGLRVDSPLIMLHGILHLDSVVHCILRYVFLYKPPPTAAEGFDFEMFVIQYG